MATRKIAQYPAILLIGESGVGKSTLGNYLLGYPQGGPFKTGETNHRITLEQQIVTIEINGNKYDLVDTPGIYEYYTGNRSKDACETLERVIKNCTYGIQAIILVMKNKFDENNIKRVQEILGIMGEKSLSNTLIAFTHTRKHLAENRKNMSSSFNSHIMLVLDKVENRWFVSPHPDLNDRVIFNNNMNEAKKIIGSFTGAFTAEKFFNQKLNDRIRELEQEIEELRNRNNNNSNCAIF